MLPSISGGTGVAFSLYLGCIFLPAFETNTAVGVRHLRRVPAITIFLDVKSLFVFSPRIAAVEYLSEIMGDDKVVEFEPGGV